MIVGKCESIWTQECNRNVSGEEWLRLGVSLIDICLGEQASIVDSEVAVSILKCFYTYVKTVYINQPHLLF